MNYATEFCILTSANLDRGNGLLWYSVECGNKGGLNRLSRRVVGGYECAEQQRSCSVR